MQVEQVAIQAEQIAVKTRWQTAMWWVFTLGVLVVLDDLTVGPFVWLAAALTSPWVAFIAALTCYAVGQVYIVWQGTQPVPSRAAAFMLRRLNMERRRLEVRDREELVHRKVTGFATALLFAPVIGGVLPPMLLWRGGYDRRFVRRVSVVTAGIYAVAFALIHGLGPGLIL